MATIMQSHIIEPTLPHTHTIILFHGRGSTGAEFAHELFESKVDDMGAFSPMTLAERFPTCRWIFPTAKLRRSTVFQEDMHEWFDIVSLGDPSEREELQVSGLVHATQLLKTIIDNRGTPLDMSRVVLGGISQGFATSVVAMIALNLECAGFIGLSGWMPFSSQIRSIVTGISAQNGNGNPGHSATIQVRRLLNLEAEEALSACMSRQSSNWDKTPIFVGHETGDPIVDYKLGQSAHEVLQDCGMQPEFHAYEDDSHWISEPEEINDIAIFLGRCIEPIL